MKTLVIGDLHGAYEVVRLVKKTKEVDRVVFLGDYLDSYDRPIADQIVTLTEVLEMAEAEPEKYIALIGNHERSYLFPKEMCSGFNYETDAMVTHLADRMKEVLKPYFWIDDLWLATHAGVDHWLLEERGETLQEYLEGGDHTQISKARGGWDNHGGLYWQDWKDFTPVNHVNQVVGHTHYKHEGVLKYRRVGNSMNVNVDCIPYSKYQNIKDAIFLIIEDGILKEVDWEYLEYE